LGTNVNAAIYGSRISTSSINNYALINYSTASSLRFDRGAYTQSPIASVSSDGYVIVKRVGANNYINGELINQYTAQFAPPNLSLFLFQINENGHPVSGPWNNSVRIHHCTIKIGNNIINPPFSSTGQ